MKRILDAKSVEEVQEVTCALLPGADGQETPADILEYIQRTIDHAVDLGHKEGKTPPPQTMGCAIAKEVMEIYPDRINLDHGLRIATAITLNLHNRFDPVSDFMNMLSSIANVERSDTPAEEGEKSNDQ